ncbi:hypothetical protein D3C73_965820 [compost metagenome]
MDGPSPSMIWPRSATPSAPQAVARAMISSTRAPARRRSISRTALLIPRRDIGSGGGLDASRWCRPIPTPTAARDRAIFGWRVRPIPSRAGTTSSSGARPGTLCRAWKAGIGWTAEAAPTSSMAAAVTMSFWAGRAMTSSLAEPTTTTSPAGPAMTR